METQNIQIFQWDVIDQKMKQKMSKPQYNLYKRVKSSKVSKGRNLTLSCQDLSNELVKIKDSIISYIKKKEVQKKKKPMLILQNSLQNQKCQQQHKHLIGRSLSIKRYRIQTVQDKNTILMHQLQSQIEDRNKLNVLKNRSRQRSRRFNHRSSTNASLSSSILDKSLTKQELKTKYKFISNSLNISKIKLKGSQKKDKNIKIQKNNRQQNSQKQEVQQKCQKLLNPNIEDQSNMGIEQFKKYSETNCFSYQKKKSYSSLSEIAKLQKQKKLKKELLNLHKKQKLKL